MENVADVAAALGDPIRLEIMDLLARGRAEAPCSPTNPAEPAAVCACDLAPALGGMAPSKLAYHMGRLRKAGLVTEQRRGKWVYYAVNTEAVAAFAGSLTARWSPPVRGIAVAPSCSDAPSPAATTGVRNRRRRARTGAASVARRRGGRASA